MTVVHPVPFTHPQPPTRLERATTAVVRRALPVVAASAASLVATLAAERAMREVAMNLVERLGAMPAGARQSGGLARGFEEVARTVVTETTIVERIRRRA